MGLLSAAQITVIKCEIFGIPEGGAGVIVTSLSHIPPSLAQSWEPTYSIGSFTNALDQIDDRLEAVTASQLTRIERLLTRWDEIGATSPLKLIKDSEGGEGIIADHQEERESIRRLLSNIIGLWCPRGGFWAETERIMSRYASYCALGARI